MRAADGAVIGMDLGGTNLRVAAVSSAGEVLTLHREETGAHQGPDAVIARILIALKSVARRVEEGGAAVRGAVLGAPGIIARREGVVVSSPNLPGWRDVPLRGRVEAAVGPPVLLENDANAAAFGEFWRGAGRGCSSMVLLTLGTGVGGGLVLGGELWRGADGMAGEIGHMTIDPGGKTCRCGNAGCLETCSSATAVVDRYRDLSGGEETVTAEEVHRRAREGDANARQAYREAGRALGIAFASLVNLLNPERIVIGGGVLPAWESFMPAAEQELRRRAFSAPARRAAILPAALGDLAGVIGAAGLLWREIETQAA